MEKKFSATCDLYLEDEIIEDSECSGTGDEKDLTRKNIAKVIARLASCNWKQVKIKEFEIYEEEGKLENHESLISRAPSLRRKTI